MLLTASLASSVALSVGALIIAGLPGIDGVEGVVGGVGITFSMALENSTLLNVLFSSLKLNAGIVIVVLPEELFSDGVNVPKRTKVPSGYVESASIVASSRSRVTVPP